MSFLTLFAAGRSVVGMGDAKSPYRIRPANLLPKFESAKNPFAPKPSENEGKAEQTPDLAPVKTSLIPPTPRPAIMETGSLFDNISKPAIVLVPVEMPKTLTSVPMEKEMVEKICKTEVAPVVKDASAKPMIPAPVKAAVAAPVKLSRGPLQLKPNFSLWVKKLNPIAWLGSLKASKSKTTVRPKQAELCLEKIKVMRNHLNDADLEIKGSKTSGKKFALAARLQPLTTGHTKTLDRLTTRFFGASSNQLQTHAQCQITTTIQ